MTDLGSEYFRDTLQHVRDHPPAGTHVDVPGIERRGPQGSIFDDHIRPLIEKADSVIALADSPNINVAFEMGYALGLKKKVSLACTVLQTPQWLIHPPFRGYFVDCIDSVGKLESFIRSDVFIPIPPKPVRGREILFLSGWGLGETYSRRIRASKIGTAWRLLRAAGWNLQDLPSDMRQIGTIVWVIPPTKPDALRDGESNAAMAALAGYAAGIGVSVRVLKSRVARELVDVGRTVREFTDLDEFDQLCREIDGEAARG